jgi:pantothenate kinase
MWAMFQRAGALPQETIETVNNSIFDPQWWHSFWSFMAGAGLVAAFWAFQSLRNLLPDEIAADDRSWVDPWNNLREKSWKVFVENSEFYYYNHIGELPPPPKRRSQWPWQTIRRGVFSKRDSESTEKLEKCPSSRMTSFATADDRAESDDISDECQGDSEERTQHQKEFCIGSIFGMDVGGTLAKLVYFEQKPADYDLLVSTSQHRQYTVSDAAQDTSIPRNSNSTSSIPVSSTYTMASSSMVRSSGQTKGPFEPPAPSPRHRRSVSLGCMGRFKDLQRQMYEVEVASLSSDTDQNCSENANAGLPGKRSSLRTKHFEDLRQESLPRDRQNFREGVHFDEKDPELPHRDLKANGHDVPHKQNMRKSRSMFDLSQSKQKAVALDRFYSFARTLDSYENSVRDPQLSFFSRELGGEFHFIHFESRWMNYAMDLIRYNDLHLNISKMGATGGGAHKYAAEWEAKLGIQMDKQEELDSLVAGMQFVLSTVVGECYTFRPHEQQGEQKGLPVSAPPSRVASSTSSDSDVTVKDHRVGAPLLDESMDESFDEHKSTEPTRKTYINQNSSISPIIPEEQTTEAPYEKPSKTTNSKVDEWWWSRKVQRDAISYSKSYPYLLVTIGTGVSILRVDGPRQHERISGSTIGGGTYWGLIRLLTDVEDFEDVMRLAEKGDPAKVDMMVGDIYGENSDALEKLGLPSNVVASSFGKLVSKEDPAAGLEQEDLARALLLMITNNIGQVSYLNAKLHNTRRIYFVGNFLRGNTLSQRRLSYAIDYWSKGEMEALFLEHEGYFGALGAFLMSQKIEQDDGGFVQWGEKDGQSLESAGSMEAGRNNRKSESAQSLFKQRRLQTFGA